MAIDLDAHFLSIVEREFPRHAELHVREESGSICIYVDWKLGTDPQRPNKRSKKIKICISEPAVDDYSDGSEQNRKGADQKLQQLVAAGLKSFDPEHNVPAHVPVPIEQWTITTEMLNSYP